MSWGWLFKLRIFIDDGVERLEASVKFSNLHCLDVSVVVKMSLWGVNVVSEQLVYTEGQTIRQCDVQMG